MKYIVLRSPNGDAPVLFPRTFLHSYVAEVFRPMEVSAAGFVRTSDGSIECYGASQGLGIRSRPGRDTALVGAMLNEGTNTVSRGSAVDAAPVDGGVDSPLNKDAGRR